MRTPVLLVTLLVACGGSQKPSPSASDEAAAAPPASTAGEHTAPPYTAAQIHDANPSGTVYRYRVREEDKETTQVSEFVTADAEGAEVRTTTLDAEGKPVGEVQSSRSTWADFESHAHYPAASTKVTTSEVEVPAGKFTTTLYEVTEERDGATIVTRAHFDTAHAGPPVHLSIEANGRVVMEMVLLERR